MSVSWSERYRLRRAIEARYPSVFRIPVAPRPSAVLLRHLAPGLRVLDVGAGPGRTRERVLARFPDTLYRTVDVDPEVQADHRSLDEVRGRFDRVLAFELVEHLAPEEADTLVERARALLVPGGKLIASTPNVFHPSAWFRDRTHRTPLAYDELGAMLLAHGLRVVELWRIHNAPWLAKLARRTLGEPLHRFLGLDYARSIVAVAQAAG